MYLGKIGLLLLQIMDIFLLDEAYNAPNDNIDDAVIADEHKRPHGEVRSKGSPNIFWKIVLRTEAGLRTAQSIDYPIQLEADTSQGGRALKLNGRSIADNADNGCSIAVRPGR